MSLTSLEMPQTRDGGKWVQGKFRLFTAETRHQHQNTRDRHWKEESFFSWLFFLCAASNCSLRSSCSWEEYQDSHLQHNISAIFSVYRKQMGATDKSQKAGKVMLLLQFLFFFFTTDTQTHKLAAMQRNKRPQNLQQAQTQEFTTMEQ